MKRIKIWVSEGAKLVICMLYMLSFKINVYAATWADVNNAVAPLARKVGGFIMFMGAIKLAESIKNEDSSAKAGAVNLLFAGFLIMLVCTDLFPSLF